MTVADDIRADAQRLARRLAALPEAAMRRAVLGEELVARDPADMVLVLAELVRWVREVPAPPYTVAMIALAAALDETETTAGGPTLSYDLRAQLYAAAKEARLTEVARLFFAAPTGPGDGLREPDPEQVVAPKGRALTLGERKSLARGGRRELLARLLRDPDAAVIRVLLGNRNLIERDVVFVAARRPVRPEVLRAVFESRWLRQHAVRRALILNPYTPADVAVRLLTTVELHDLRDVAGDPNLNDAVRSQARLLLNTSPSRG